MFKNLKSLFVIEDEDESKKKASSKVKAKSKKTKNSFSKQSSSTIQESAKGKPGKVSTKFTDVLFGAMEKANIEGFDYMEYKQSLNSLKNMAMDEQTRFRSAFAMAQTMGATPGNLIEAATHYIKILESEEAKFEQALLKQHSKQIGSKETEIKQLDRLIQEKKKQIEKLNEEIKSHQVVANKMKSQMSTAAGKIETTKNNFIASYNTLVSQIQDDVEKMKQHLK